MSILDDAIREHLELKRAHGADESELKRLEDEAFGPAERPDQGAQQIDPFAEAPTEFLSAPEGVPEGADAATGSRQLPNIADLQEPPPPKPVAPEESAEDADTEGPSDLAEPPSDAVESPSDVTESPSEELDRPADELDGPSEEEHPAMEHRTVAQPAPDDKPAAPSSELQPDPEAPSAAERQAAAEQPTELFDVEGQFADTAEPPVDPLAEIEDSGKEVEATGPADEDPEDEFDEFFSEQRLSDELNQALEAPLPDEPGAPATDEGPFLDPDAELGPPEPEPKPEDSAEQDRPDRPEDSAEQDQPGGTNDPSADEYKPHEPGHSDALEDTPEFLEDEPEGDDAWFEQRPPKDFDFGD